TTTQVTGRFLGLPSEPPLTGYEIHMGVTEPTGEGTPVCQLEAGGPGDGAFLDGWATPDFRVWGSYVHGLFDRDAFRQAWLSALRQEKGLTAVPRPAYAFEKFQEEQFDRLAAIVRQHLDLAFLRRLITPA
ncbi:MAG: cobyric acid synthase, partial [Desulfobacca sp.]